MNAAPDEQSSPFVWFGGVALALILAVATAMLVVAIFGGGGGDDDPAPATPETASVGSRLADATSVLEAPRAGAPEVARLEGNAEVRVVGRLANGLWFAIEAGERGDVVGWVRTSAVLDAPPGAEIPVVAAPGASTSTPSSTVVPEAADLALEEVRSSQNQLVVSLTNLGGSDITTAVLVSINGGEPQRIEVAEKPLRPGDRLDLPLDGEYVQRRATLEVSATIEDGEDADESNNEVTATIGPDVPNDLEVGAVTLEPFLAVEVRNNSPIPIVGVISVGVRETRPTNALLGRRDDLPVQIEAGGSVSVPFDGLRGLDLTRIQVILDTNAINDADPTNDVYPR